MALRRTAASTRRPRSRSVKSWRAALTTAEATTAVARIGSGTAAPSMRDSVMGGISRRAGLGRAARRSLKTAAAQTLPGPALPLPAILLMRAERRGRGEGCGAASAAPQRWVIRQRRPVSARSRRPRPPAPRRRRGTPAVLADLTSDGGATSASRSGSGSQRVSSSRRSASLAISLFLRWSMSCMAPSPLASRTASRIRALGDTAEIVVDRRSPANLRHVEIDRPRQAVRLIEATLQAMGGHT